MTSYVPTKDPNNVEPYFFVWCSKAGTNDGGTSDTGELQGATIASYSITVESKTGDPTPLVADSDNKDAVTIKAISYGANTVVTVWLSAGWAAPPSTPQYDYTVLCRIVTSDSRTLDKTMVVPVREN